MIPIPMKNGAAPVAFRNGPKTSLLCHPLKNDGSEHIESRAPIQAAFANLAEIKRDSIWRLSRLAGEHLDRLLWSVEHDDDAEVRNQCRAVVAHVRAIAILINDMGAAQ
jgi:hypothetical protein